VTDNGRNGNARGDATRARVHVGGESELPDGERWLVQAGGTTIGVFRVGDSWIAYENTCPHSGGPVCEGFVKPSIKAVVDEGGRLLTETTDETQLRLSCPWHGWDFDLRTGVAIGDPQRRLRPVAVEVDDGDVYVVV
jgi:nitrite reductase (NADH) small subunit